MNDQSHAHQDSPQPGGESTSNWKAWGIGCLLATLVVLSPMGMIFLAVKKGYHDARRAQDEFKRVANPDELRAWALMQIKKHPKGGYMKVSDEERPKTCPHFAGSRGLYLNLDASNVDPSHRDDLLRAILVWDFSAGYGLQVTVWLNSDGTPPNLEDESDWARGIATYVLSK